MKRILTMVLCCVVVFSGLTGCQRVSKAADKYLYDPTRSDPAKVSMNKQALSLQKNSSFRFMVIGHGYGSTSVDDHLPDQALLAKITELKSMDLSMLVSLGDLVQHSIPEDFDNLERSFLAELPFPVFNVPGNHDVVNRAAYESRFGHTYYSFRAGRAQMVFLDTEREDCAIDAAQQKMLEKVVASALKDKQTQFVFVFMHKTLFFNNERLAELNQTRGLPNVMDCFASEQFAGILQNTLIPAAQLKPVYIFGGDVGAWENLSPYYEKMADADLTMVMTGLGDHPSDSAILVTVGDTAVQMEVYPLTGQTVLPLEMYTPEYWIEQVAQ